MIRSFGPSEMLFLLESARWTLLLTLGGAGLGGLLGLVVAIARVSQDRVLRRLATGYIGIIQGIPVLILLFLSYYGLSKAGFDFPPLIAASLSLAIYSSGYLGDIWRGAIQSVPIQQWEASASLALTPLQQYLVFMRSPFAVVSLVRRELAGLGMPFNDYLVMRPDRVGFLDYRRTDVAAIKRQRIVDLVEYYHDYPPAPPERWLHDLEQVSEWVRMIQARGGKVVFFREPSAGEHLALDEKNYPRALYWDAYARVSPAPMIEFRDEPGFASITLPARSVPVLARLPGRPPAAGRGALASSPVPPPEPPPTGAATTR